MRVALDMKKLALGIIYKNPSKHTYEENIRIYDSDSRPLFERDLDEEKLKELVNTFR